jgi:capsular polysaccharide biosynthesis protein
MELRRYWQIMRRWSWFVIGTLIAGLLVSWLVAENTTPVYAARARLIVGPTVESPRASIDTIRAAQQFVVTYREIVKTGAPLDATIARLNLSETRVELAGKISVQSSDVTRILTIRVRDSDPERAAQIANTLSAVMVERSAQSEQPESQLTLIEDAEPNFSPVEPNKPILILLGTAAALLVAGALILLIEVIQGFVKTEHDLRTLTRSPVLATFTLGRRRNQADPFFASDRREHPVGEGYHLASLKLLAGVELGSAGHTVLVCSPSSTDLAAEVSAYLAAACAQLGHPTLAVDGDMIDRRLSRFFALERSSGFAELVGEADSDRAAMLPASAGASSAEKLSVPLHDARSVPQLHVLPAGTAGQQSALSPSRLRATIDALRDVPVVTIISGPALNSSSDGLVLAESVDSVVLVAVSDHTHSVDVQDAAENMRLVGVERVWGLLVRKSTLGRWSRLPMFQRDRRASVVESEVIIEAARLMTPSAQGSA